MLPDRRAAPPAFLSDRSRLLPRCEPRLLLTEVSRNLVSDSVLFSLPVSESFAALREPLLRDFGSRLPESPLLFRSDCAECGLPGDSPLRLRAPGAGLCLPGYAKQMH